MENIHAKKKQVLENEFDSDISSSSEMEGKHLTFWTDNQLFAIPIASVEQIIGIQNIIAIPGFPNYVKGIINLRGNIIPVIDMRLRFNKQVAAYNERTCIIVTNIQQHLFGLIVDAVDEVTRIDEASISMPPKVLDSEASAYLKGVAKLENKVVLLLDTAKILDNDEIQKTA